MIIGASFTGSTVKVNLVVSTSSPSETDTIRSAFPCQFALGVAIIEKSSELT